MISQFEKRVLAGIVLAGILVLSVAGLAIYSEKLFISSSEWVAHTHAVIAELQTVLSDLTLLDSKVRAYLLTGDESLLSVYKDAQGDLERHLWHVLDLTVDNSSQHTRLLDLESKIHSHLELLNQAAEVRRASSLEAGRSFFVSHATSAETDEIRLTVREATLEEDRLLEERSARFRERTREIRTIKLLSASLQLLLLVATFYFVRREVEHRTRAELLRERYQKQIESQNKELELRNREVERATQLKSQFLASMSHELRTPLNAILGFSELLEEIQGAEATEKQKRFLGHIRKGAHHLLQLINDILDLAKIESGQLEMRPEAFLFSDVLPEVLSNIRPLALAKRIDIGEQGFGNGRVYADRVRVKQVLYNLLSNAVKFTPEGGRVSVECQLAEPYLVVRVRDTGIGIRPEDQSLIFEEFRQADAAENRVKEGTGLGLAITKRLLEQLGGSISLESEFGKGSVFTFTLPVLAGCAVPAARVPATAPHSKDPLQEEIVERTKPVILVIDDEAAARELLTDYLRSAGYEVVTAASGTEGLNKARSLRPAGITLDILMPGGGGLQALFELKDSPETATIPVIVVSITDQSKMCLALGAVEYFVKPVQKSVLIEHLQRHIKPKPDGSRSILIVDDDIQTLALIESTLSSAGYKVYTARDGEEALDALSRIRVDSILLDLLMPKMDGFELMRRLKEKTELQQIPVFVLTAKELEPSEIELLARQARAFFNKDKSWKESLLTQVQKVVPTQN